MFLILTLFGLIIPFSPASLYPNAAAFGLLAGLLAPRRLAGWLVLAVYTLLLLSRWPAPLSLGAIFIALISLSIARSAGYWQKFLPAVILAVLILGLGITALSEGHALREELRRDPGESYTTDMRGHLKTYYLMKARVNFPEAYLTGMRGAFHGSQPTDIWGWRQSVFFLLWQKIPGGTDSIYLAALLLFATTLLTAYALARCFLPPRQALLSPFLLWPYLHLPLTELTLLQLEWWGLPFFLAGLLFLLRRRALLAGILFTFTLGARETFTLSLAAVALVWLAKNRRDAIKLLSPLLVFLAYFLLLHLPQISPYIQEVSRPLIFRDPRIINVTLAFATRNYLLGIWRPILILLTTTSILLIFTFLRQPQKRFLSAFLLASYLSFFTSLIALTPLGIISPWHDYWGIYYAPLLLILAPVAAGYWRETRRSILPPGK
jgi:hypothetical protein